MKGHPFFGLKTLVLPGQGFAAIELTKDGRLRLGDVDNSTGGTVLINTDSLFHTFWQPEPVVEYTEDMQHEPKTCKLPGLTEYWKRLYAAIAILSLAGKVVMPKEVLRLVAREVASSEWNKWK